MSQVFTHSRRSAWPTSQHCRNDQMEKGRIMYTALGSMEERRDDEVWAETWSCTSDHAPPTGAAVPAPPWPPVPSSRRVSCWQTKQGRSL